VSPGAPPGPPRAFDVVVAGNAGVDTNVFLQKAAIDFEVEANFTENLDCAGQAGVYASRSYAALGFRTAFIGHVGDDWAGRLVREAFAQDGVATDLLGTDPAGTARSVNILYPDGRRKNFYDGKGHMELAMDLGACRQLLARTKLLHLHLANWTRTLLPLARELGVPIACDLQDIVALEDPYRADYIRQADILFASSVNHPDPAPLIRALFAAGRARLVVCGMGAEGCALGTREAGRVDLRRFPALSLPEPVIDTNGAGDSLAAGFLSSHVLQGLPLEASILRGQLAARHACAQRATSARQITKAQLDRLSSQFRETP